MAASAYYVYQRRQKIASLDTITFCVYKQPILTKQWNDIIFVQILYSYLKYTNRLLDVFFILLAVISSELHDRNSREEVFCRKGVLRNFAIFTRKHMCESLFFNKVAGNFIKKETLAQVFFCEFCEISKNTFFYRTSLVVASVYEKLRRKY